MYDGWSAINPKIIFKSHFVIRKDHVNIPTTDFDESSSGHHVEVSHLEHPFSFKWLFKLEIDPFLL